MVGSVKSMTKTRPINYVSGRLLPRSNVDYRPGYVCSHEALLVHQSWCATLSKEHVTNVDAAHSCLLWVRCSSPALPAFPEKTTSTELCLH